MTGYYVTDVGEKPETIVVYYSEDDRAVYEVEYATGPRCMVVLTDLDGEQSVAMGRDALESVIAALKLALKRSQASS
jgi:hypothetical protein